jgi:hypothetical protein
LRRQDQFNHLIDILGEDSPFNAKGWKLQYKNYYGTFGAVALLHTTRTA